MHGGDGAVALGSGVTESGLLLLEMGKRREERMVTRLKDGF